MKKFAVTNIDIDYDEIRGEWRCLSKREIKRAVYNFVYGHLSYDHLEELVDENAQIKAYWHYGLDAPVVLVPSTQGWVGAGTFTRPVLHECSQNKCVAYKFGKCLKYDNYTEYGDKFESKEVIEHDGCMGCVYEDFEELEEPCAYCKGTYKHDTMAYLKAKDCYVSKVDKRKE